MGERVFRLAVRVLFVAVLTYPLTGAASPQPDRYAEYMYGQSSDSGGGCFDQASQLSGGWVCSYDPSP